MQSEPLMILSFVLAIANLLATFNLGHAMTPEQKGALEAVFASPMTPILFGLIARQFVSPAAKAEDSLAKVLAALEKRDGGGA